MIKSGCVDSFFNQREDILEYFGYVEDWAIIPLANSTYLYWRLIAHSNGDLRSGKNCFVQFADTVEDLKSGDEDKSYFNEVWPNRHLPKWVYPTEEYTMICVDTQTDGNKFLQIFLNSKEVK